MAASRLRFSVASRLVLWALKRAHVLAPRLRIAKPTCHLSRRTGCSRCSPNVQASCVWIYVDTKHQFVPRMSRRQLLFAWSCDAAMPLLQVVKEALEPQAVQPGNMLSSFSTSPYPGCSCSCVGSFRHASHAGPCYPILFTCRQCRGSCEPY